MRLDQYAILQTLDDTFTNLTTQSGDAFLPGGRVRTDLMPGSTLYNSDYRDDDGELSFEASFTFGLVTPATGLGDTYRSICANQDPRYTSQWPIMFDVYNQELIRDRWSCNDDIFDPSKAAWTIGRMADNIMNDILSHRDAEQHPDYPNPDIWYALEKLAVVVRKLLINAVTVVDMANAVDESLRTPALLSVLAKMGCTFRAM